MYLSAFCYCIMVPCSHNSLPKQVSFSSSRAKKLRQKRIYLWARSMHVSSGRALSWVQSPVPQKEKAEKKKKNLPMVTQLLSGRTRIWALAIWFWDPSWNFPFETLLYVLLLWDSSGFLHPTMWMNTLGEKKW
jgi:hypothetical protein